MQNTKFIVNPVAGALGTKKKWPLITSLLRYLGIGFDYQYTEGVGHAIELAKLAASDGYRRVVAVGGDGTVNEVANGIINSKNPAETKLGVISTGTGSDFIRSVGIPRDYVKACSCLTSERSLTVDVGVVEYHKLGKKTERYFINTAGIGFDAAVVATTEKASKRFGGTIPYLLGFLRTMLTYRNKPVTIRVDDEIETRRVVSVMVANGCFAGGGMRFAPGAKLDDGFLDMLVISDMSKFELVKAFPSVYKGTHIYHPKVKLHQTTQVSVESTEKLPVYADGEVLGEGPVTFRLMSHKLQIVV